MLDPIGDGEDAAFFKKSSDLKLLRCRVLDPIVNVVGDLKRRHILVTVFLESLESDSSVPLLSAHCQKFFRRIGDQRDVLEKENVSVASKSGLVRQRRQHFSKFFAKTVERIRRTISRAVQLLLLESCGFQQCRRHLMQAGSNFFKRLNCYRGKWRWRFVEILDALLQDRGDIFDACENFPAKRCIIRSWYGERFDYRRERWGDKKFRTGFPARINVQFPTHPRQSRTDQFVINLTGNRPLGRVDLFPTRFELGKILSLFVDGVSRPIASPARPLYSIDVDPREWRVFRTPGPKIVRQFIQRFSWNRSIG